MVCDIIGGDGGVLLCDRDDVVSCVKTLSS